jgi:hypothetical protein
MKLRTSIVFSVCLMLVGIACFFVVLQQLNFLEGTILFYSILLPAIGLAQLFAAMFSVLVLRSYWDVFMTLVPPLCLLVWYGVTKT